MIIGVFLLCMYIILNIAIYVVHDLRIRNCTSSHFYIYILIIPLQSQTHPFVSCTSFHIIYIFRIYSFFLAYAGVYRCPKSQKKSLRAICVLYHPFALFVIPFYHNHHHHTIHHMKYLFLILSDR